MRRDSQKDTEQEPTQGSSSAGERSPLSVTAVIQIINTLFDEALPVITFQGEISQLTRAASGHVYFTVKDEMSQLQCVMWRSTAFQLGFNPKEGLSVICTGKPNVYQGNGRFQLVVQRMIEGGEGALRQRFLELKGKLESAGYFAVERKRSLPSFPERIGVVTSRNGAVLHDIMVKIRERMPSTQVYLIDTRVQGAGAAGEIAAAIDLYSRTQLVEVVIVARGGGSLEDLWAFNEEEVVQAIFRCSKPVVSGVGHETDITLADLVADVRAPTPTAAAELVVPKVSELLERIDLLTGRFVRIQAQIENVWQHLDLLTSRLDRSVVNSLERVRLAIRTVQARVAVIRPEVLLSRMAERISARASLLLSKTIQLRFNSALRLRDRIARLERSGIGDRLAETRRRVDYAAMELGHATERHVVSASGRLEIVGGRLDAIDPRRVLQRGFSVVRSKGKVLVDAGSLKQGEIVNIRLAQGQIDASVEKIFKPEEN